MGQVTAAPPAVQTPAADVWGQALNTLLTALKEQGNAADAAIAVIVETIQDTVAAMLVGNGITFAYNDATGQITATVTAGSAPAALSNISPPTISGTLTAGSTLTATPGTWAPTPDGFAYQWRRSGSAIADATASSYTLTPADLNLPIIVAVVARKAGYTDTYETSVAVTPTSSVSTSALTTEDGNHLTTEDGDLLVAQ